MGCEAITELKHDPKNGIECYSYLIHFEDGEVKEIKELIMVEE